MDKQTMREYVAELETRIDRSLSKWKKESKIENGEAIQVEWQFEQAHIILELFYLDGHEAVHLECRAPRVQSHYQWSGLTKTTMNKVMDRAGNFAQVIQHPIRGYDE
jgi:hypothetical protein